MTEYAEIIGSPQVVNFISAAEKYCLKIEDRKKYDSEEFLKDIFILLVDLYQKAINLDYYCLDAANGFEHNGTTHQQWDEIYKDLNEKLGEQNYYRIILEPYEPVSEEIVTGCLADDFSDVYRDLKDSLLKLKLDDQNAKSDALNDFVTDFKIHWGKHAVEAIWALHHCIISVV